MRASEACVGRGRNYESGAGEVAVGLGLLTKGRQAYFSQGVSSCHGNFAAARRCVERRRRSREECRYGSLKLVHGCGFSFESADRGATPPQSRPASLGHPC
ncbi:hypothetical protein MRX96_034365 [Rhipicephalus microplus]